jgi:hypothetical protein
MNGDGMVARDSAAKKRLGRVGFVGVILSVGSLAIGGAVAWAVADRGVDDVVGEPKTVGEVRLVDSGRSMAGDIDWEFFARDTDRGLCVGVRYSGAIGGTGESCGVDAGLAEGQPFPRIDKSSDIFHEFGVSFVYGLVPPSTSRVILSFDDGSTATVETISVSAPDIKARAYVLELDQIARAQMGIALDSAGQEIVQQTFEVFAPPANP